jgi:hypothetical protein
MQAILTGRILSQQGTWIYRAKDVAIDCVMGYSVGYNCPMDKTATSVDGNDPRPQGVPSHLLKFYEKEEYALSFIKGEMRFGNLAYYKGIEGTRRDSTEGSVSFFWNQKAPQINIDRRTGQYISRVKSEQNIHYSGCSMNPHFILATTHPEANRQMLEERFGKFIVQINEPMILLERIKTAWQTHPRALCGYATIVQVTYNKDGLLEADPYLIAPPHYAYSQKPESFEKEREFRYVLECTIDTSRSLADYLTLMIPPCDDICSLI